MTVTTFQTATVATPKADVSLANSPQPSRQLDLQVWTSVTARAAPDRPHGASEPDLSLGSSLVLGLRRALNVRIYETADDVAVEDPATGVFGAGGDLNAAILDFQTALHDHLDVLTSDDTLAPPLRRQLETLPGYFNTP